MGNRGHEGCGRGVAQDENWREGAAACAERPRFAAEAGLLRQVFELDAPVKDGEMLLFVLAPMLDQVLVQASRMAVTLVCVTVEMELEDGTVHDMTIHPEQPAADRKLLLQWMERDLARHAPAAGVMTLTMTAETEGLAHGPAGLFSPQLPESSRLEVTLARLVVLMGHGRAGGAPRETCEPDPFSSVASPVAGRAGADADDIDSPVMRSIRPPAVVWLQVRDGRPERFAFRDRVFRVVKAYGPWKGSGTWWSLARWGREEWDLLAEGKGERLSCRVVRDFVARRWVVEGVYD